MSTWHSALLGIRTSGDYFVSTFIFGIMFGIAAAAIGIENWQAMLMSASVFTASGQFAALEFWQSPLPLGTIALSVALVSSRNLEGACRENIVFMALAGGEKPDHSTFASFVTRLEGDPARKIFAEILRNSVSSILSKGTLSRLPR